MVCFAVTAHQRAFYALTQNRNGDSAMITRSCLPAQDSSAQVCDATKMMLTLNNSLEKH